MEGRNKILEFFIILINRFFGGQLIFQGLIESFIANNIKIIIFFK
jgi:hypothetical protein